MNCSGSTITNACEMHVKKWQWRAFLGASWNTNVRTSASDLLSIDWQDGKSILLSAAYQLTVSIASNKYDGTAEPQYVKIRGTLGETEEKQCTADFNLIGQNVTCIIWSGATLGNYRCLVWRNGGPDGWDFTEVILLLTARHFYVFASWHLYTYK